MLNTLSSISLATSVTSHHRAALPQVREQFTTPPNDPGTQACRAARRSSRRPWRQPPLPRHQCRRSHGGLGPFEIFEGPYPGSFAVSVRQTTSTCAISGVFSTPRRLTSSQASGLLAAKDTLNCGKIFEIFRRVQLGASPKAVIAGLASQQSAAAHGDVQSPAAVAGLDLPRDRRKGIVDDEITRPVAQKPPAIGRRGRVHRGSDSGRVRDRRLLAQHRRLLAAGVGSPKPFTMVAIPFPDVAGAGNPATMFGDADYGIAVSDKSSHQAAATTFATWLTTSKGRRAGGGEPA